MNHSILRISLMVLAGILCSGGSIMARNIKGRVTAGGEQLSGIIVTDGKTFTTTDKRGNYILDANKDADFVYIVTPNGYTANYATGAPQFYKSITDKKSGYDFELETVANAANNPVLIAIADPQCATVKHHERFARESVNDMRKTIAAYREQNRPVYGIGLGDLCWDNFELLDAYKKEIADLNIPFYAVIGNHDHDLKAQGDYNTEHIYRDKFGPNYYAFNLGNIHYIVLDNIIYQHNKQYKEAVDQRQIDWLKQYVNFIPVNAEVCIAMHAPATTNLQNNGTLIPGMDSVLDIFKNHQLSFISGHSHLNVNYMPREGVMDYNIASIGGAWWTSQVNRDGTPCGYHIFEHGNKQRTEYYKSVDKPSNYQMQVYPLGTMPQYANAVVAKVWNVTPQWSVTWQQDGVPMGEMTRVVATDPDYLRYLQKRRDQNKAEVKEYKQLVPSNFFFKAIPSATAKQIIVKVKNPQGEVYIDTVRNSVDVHAHRGGMGLMPENTIEAMKNAMDLGVNTLELDLAVSKDGQIVVSHDPYFNAKFVLTPQGDTISRKKTKNYKLYTMPYDSIRRYDTGSKPHPDYPQQAKLKTYKPLLTELIDSVENYALRMGYPPMRYNIEIKSSVANDNVFSPDYKTFTDKAMAVLMSKQLGNRLIVQSFDVRGLNYLQSTHPDVRKAYLVDKKKTDFQQNMKQLEFVPEYYSPHYSIVTPQMVKECHNMNMKVVPWTVDKIDDIETILNLGVDAIITNYPDRVLKLTRGF
ncbi:MAG: calcineurin-like phosphoesterase C-terminal domain-containing protein [Marinifilaceae bacterium]